MKMTVVGLKPTRIKRVFAKHFVVSAKKPDFVVSYGGDGTLLHAERVYPGVPKLAVRNNAKCEVCKSKKTKTLHKASEKIYCDSAASEIILRLKQKKFKIESFEKVKGTAFAKRNGKTKRFTLVGLNEVQIHNSNHSHAIRFEFCLNGACIAKEIIGDGVVASTAYGSSAYFYAITQRKFKKGFGIAFNNTIRKHKPLFLKGKFKAEVRVHRRHAVLLADNNLKAIALREGDRVVIEPAKEKARIITM
ncbi:MAG: hypothetical protein QXR53_04830 [Candidatus Norongarragalinales archaeon]